MKQLIMSSNLTLAGHKDWRLPTIKELITIIDYEAVGPTIDSNFFPGTEASLNPTVYYWSSTEKNNSIYHAWGVNFFSGYIAFPFKSPGNYARCVRGHSLEFNAFTDNGDGTTTHNNTKLMWQKDSGGEMDWESAIQYCENLTLAGYNEWRLPNIKELSTLTDFNRSSPAINTDYFPNTLNNTPGGSDSYWSSTTSDYVAYGNNIDSALTIYYPTGGLSSDRKDAYPPPFVRCVQTGP